MLNAVDLLDLNRRLLHARLLGENRIYLAQFDPQAAKLDLVVLPSENFKEAVRHPPSVIAGLVDAVIPIGDEALLRHLRQFVVSQADAPAADPHLAHQAGGQQISIGVNNVFPDAGRGPAEGNRFVICQIMLVAGNGDL